MIQTILTRSVAVALGIIVLFLVGCAGRSREARFYVLSPAADTGLVMESPDRARDVTIAIEAVSLPKYLRKPQIVTRTGNNEMHLAEYDRWAGKLEEDIGRVIAENLANMLSTDKVFAYPAMETVPFNYSIEITVSRFDGRLGGDLEFDARWVIFDSQGGIVSRLKATHIVERTDGGEHADMVAAQSRALAVFSHELADAIKGLTDG